MLLLLLGKFDEWKQTRREPPSCLQNNEPCENMVDLHSRLSHSLLGQSCGEVPEPECREKFIPE